MDAQAKAAVIATKQKRIEFLQRTIAKLVEEADAEQREIEIPQSPEFGGDAEYVTLERITATPDFDDFFPF